MPILLINGVSSISPTALLVASLDLQVVRSIRDAIRTADIESGLAVAGRRAERTDQFEPREKFNPQSAVSSIASRVIVHPTPRFLPREVIQPVPTIAPAPAQPEHVHKMELTFQPPWKTLPYPDKIPAPQKIKMTPHQPDILHKGTMIDFFC